MNRLQNRALFLDRDGVLNELIYYASSGEFESPRTPADLRLMPGLADGLLPLQDAGWRLFLVSNQPSYTKGKCSLEDLHAVHAALNTALLDQGVRLEQAFYCYHHPQGRVPGYSGPCACRKPKPFFLQKAAAELELDLSASWMIGDQETDIQCGQAAGCKTALIPNSFSAAKRGQASPDLICETLQRFSEAILETTHV